MNMNKKTIEDAVQKVKTASSGTDTAAIKAATEELQKAFYAVSEKLYQQANPQGGPNPGAGYNPGAGAGYSQNNAGQNGGDYYDADYEVVDDDNNKK